MSFTPEGLKPSNPFLKIDGREVELSLLTLNMTVKLQEVYGNVNDIFKIIKEDPTKITEIIWTLVLDKDLFDNRFENFKKFFLNEGIKEIAMASMQALNDCVTKSMPLMINKKRQADLLKLAEASSESKPCYAKYFDALSKRYGISFEGFYELTLRQVTALLKTAGDQGYADLEVQAALQGKQLKPRMAPIEISEEEDEEQDADANEMLKRLQEQHKAQQIKEGK